MFKKIDPKLFENITQTKFFNFVDKLEAIQRLLLIVIIFMAIAILSLSFGMYKVISTSKTVIIPPKVDKEFWVSDTTLSAAYYEQVGFYIADRILSVSPSTAEGSYDALLPFFSSNSKDLYAIKKMLKEQSEFIKKENVYQVFYPINVVPKAKERLLSVNGSLRKFIGTMYIHDIETRLDIKFDIANGKFIIKSLEVKK